MFQRRPPSRVEGTMQCLKNHRKMLLHQYNKATLEVERAESALRSAREINCKIAWTTAVANLAACRNNLDWQISKRRRLDESGVAVLDCGRDVELDSRAKKMNAKLRENDQECAASARTTEQSESASVKLKLTPARTEEQSESASVRVKLAANVGLRSIGAAATAVPPAEYEQERVRNPSVDKPESARSAQAESASAQVKLIAKQAATAEEFSGDQKLESARGAHAESVRQRANNVDLSSDGESPPRIEPSRSQSPRELQSEGEAWISLRGGCITCRSIPKTRAELDSWGADVVVILSTANQERREIIAESASDGVLLEWRCFDIVSLAKLTRKEYDAKDCKQLGQFAMYAHHHLQKGRKVALVGILDFKQEIVFPIYVLLRLPRPKAKSWTHHRRRWQCLEMLSGIRPALREMFSFWDDSFDLQGTADRIIADKEFQAELPTDLRREPGFRKPVSSAASASHPQDSEHPS